MWQGGSRNKQDIGGGGMKKSASMHRDMNPSALRQQVNSINSFQQQARVAAINRTPVSNSSAASVHSQVSSAGGPSSLNNEQHGIKDVWEDNLEAEMYTIRELAQHYPYIAMDTEFPGVVARPWGIISRETDYAYQLMKVNCDLLKVIQLGITFFDENGDVCRGPYHTWQFNFEFDLVEDMYAQDSINLLHSSGLRFDEHTRRGINVDHFAEVLYTSDLILNDHVTWLTFHGGYDFAYILRLLTNDPLPATQSEFFERLKVYFPQVYDIKYVARGTRQLKGGLQEVAETLKIPRQGSQHQAGSDSLLTGKVFFKCVDAYYEGDLESRFLGHLFGIGAQAPEEIVANSTGGTEDIPDAIVSGAGEESDENGMISEEAGAFAADVVNVGYSELFGVDTSQEALFDDEQDTADQTAPGAFQYAEEDEYAAYNSGMH